MSTTNTTVQALYEDIVSGLLPHYDNFVLLGQEAVLTNTFDISGSVGNVIKMPITNYWAPAAVGLADGASVIDASTNGNIEADFDPSSAQLTIDKRGAGTFVSEEALEDGGLATVRSAVLTRLSRSLAQATDLAGFRELASGSADALANLAVVDLSNDGVSNVATLTKGDVSFVMSPEAMGYGVKRDPAVKMWNDVDRDGYEMVATVRNGFKRIPYSLPGGSTGAFARAVIASDDIGEADANLKATLAMFSRSVAELRKINAPTDAAGFYMAAVSAAHEFHLASQLNSVSVGTGAIGDLSMIGNDALMSGLIGQAIGCRFIRTNNTPQGLDPS